MENYKEDLKIDPDDLDLCCVKQPALFDKYAQKLVSLCKKRDEIKLTMEITYAKLDGIIKESINIGSKKVKGTQIKDEININPQYVSLQEKYRSICYEVKECEAIKEAFIQRFSMLKILTDREAGKKLTDRRINGKL